MKINPSPRLACSTSLVAAVSLIVMLPDLSVLGAANQPPPDPAGTNEIQLLREQLNQQTKRIDRLYDALGPQLPEMEERAAALKKQIADDARLSMKEVLRSKDETHTATLTFLPNAPFLAVAENDSTVKLVSLHHEIGDMVLTGLDVSALCLATPENGRSEMFVGTPTGRVFAWSQDSTNFQRIFDWKGWPVTALAVSPDGTILVCACNGKSGTNREWTKPDESILAIEVPSGKTLWSGQAGRSDFQAISFAGDGKTMSVVREGLVAVLDVETGRTIRELAHPKYPTGPLSTALSRDGKLCAVGYAPNDVGIWDVASGKCLRLLGAHKSWVVALAFSPDGSRLASSSGDTTASVWDVATGKEVGRLRFGDGYAYVNSVSISDDGRRLAAGRKGEFVVLEMPNTTTINGKDSEIHGTN
jgi:WD40 repeat protein